MKISLFGVTDRKFYSNIKTYWSNQQEFIVEGCHVGFGRPDRSSW